LPVEEQNRKTGPRRMVSRRRSTWTRPDHDQIRTLSHLYFVSSNSLPSSGATTQPQTAAHYTVTLHAATKKKTSCSKGGKKNMVDRERPARYEVGERAALKATSQPVEILEVRRGEFVPDFIYKVRVLAEKPARPYNLSVPEHDLEDEPVG
jgi:hypothetical protein